MDLCHPFKSNFLPLAPDCKRSGTTKKVRKLSRGNNGEAGETHKADGKPSSGMTQFDQVRRFRPTSALTICSMHFLTCLAGILVSDQSHPFRTFGVWERAIKCDIDIANHLVNRCVEALNIFTAFTGKSKSLIKLRQIAYFDLK